MNTAKDVLKDIDYFLSDLSIPEFERRKLWHVLTALRGPDAGSDSVKLATVGVVRRTALPMSFRARYDSYAPFSNERRSQEYVSAAGGALGADDGPDRKRIRTKLTRMHESGESSWHFYYHVVRAFNALGLEF